MDTKKKPQNNIPNRKHPNQVKPRWMTDFRTKFGLEKKCKVSQDSLKYLAELILEWVNSSPEICVFDEILSIQNTQAYVFDRWTEKCPELLNAKELAFQQIAINREKLALFKQLDQKTMFFMQGLYSPKWRAQEKYFNELKVKANTAFASPAEYAALSSKIFSEIPSNELPSIEIQEKE